MSVTTQAAEAHETDTFSVLGEALESAADTFGELTVSARDGARRAARGVSNTVGTGVYKGSYGVSYGVVFSAVFLTELLPAGSSLRRGLEDGAGAALDAAAHRRLAREGESDAGFEEPIETPAPAASRTRTRRRSDLPSDLD